MFFRFLIRLFLHKNDLFFVFIMLYFRFVITATSLFGHF